MPYVKIIDSEAPDLIVKLPTNEDGTLELSAVRSQFPDATGLRYHFDEDLRGVKLVENRLYPPEGGWDELVYTCVFPRVRAQEAAVTGELSENCGGTSPTIQQSPKSPKSPITRSKQMTNGLLKNLDNMISKYKTGGLTNCNNQNVVNDLLELKINFMRSMEKIVSTFERKIELFAIADESLYGRSLVETAEKFLLGSEYENWENGPRKPMWKYILQQRSNPAVNMLLYTISEEKSDYVDRFNFPDYGAMAVRHYNDKIHQYINQKYQKHGRKKFTSTLFVGRPGVEDFMRILQSTCVSKPVKRTLDMTTPSSSLTEKKKKDPPVANEKPSRNGSKSNLKSSDTSLTKKKTENTSPARKQPKNGKSGQKSSATLSLTKKKSPARKQSNNGKKEQKSSATLSLTKKKFPARKQSNNGKKEQKSSATLSLTKKKSPARKQSNNGKREQKSSATLPSPARETRSRNGRNEQKLAEHTIQTQKRSNGSSTESKAKRQKFASS